MLVGMMRAQEEEEEDGNPFIKIYEREYIKKKRRSDFYYVSEDLRYSEGDEERVLSGIKLNCKFLKSLYCQVKDGEWAMLNDIAMIKDIAIDEERSKKGYFTQFVLYLLNQTPYKVVYLESVQPAWLKERLERVGSLWVKQGGYMGNSYILLKSDLGEDTVIF